MICFPDATRDLGKAAVSPPTHRACVCLHGGKGIIPSRVEPASMPNCMWLLASWRKAPQGQGPVCFSVADRQIDTSYAMRARPIHSNHTLQAASSLVVADDDARAALVGCSLARHVSHRRSALHCSRHAAYSSLCFRLFAPKQIERRRREWRRGYHDSTHTQPHTSPFAVLTTMPWRYVTLGVGQASGNNLPTLSGCWLVIGSKCEACLIWAKFG